MFCHETCYNDLFIFSSVTIDSSAVELLKIMNTIFRYVMTSFISFYRTMQTNRVSKNNIIGYCEIDLIEYLTRVSFLSH